MVFPGLSSYAISKTAVNRYAILISSVFNQHHLTNLDLGLRSLFRRVGWLCGRFLKYYMAHTSRKRPTRSPLYSLPSWRHCRNRHGPESTGKISCTSLRHRYKPSVACCYSCIPCCLIPFFYAIPKHSLSLTYMRVISKSCRWDGALLVHAASRFPCRAICLCKLGHGEAGAVEGPNCKRGSAEVTYSPGRAAGWCCCPTKQIRVCVELCR